MNKDLLHKEIYQTSRDVFRFNHKALKIDFVLYIKHEEFQYASQAATDAFSILEKLEQELSSRTQNSDVLRINNATPGEPVYVGHDCLNCLKLGIHFYKISGGIFDIFTGAFKTGASRNNNGEIRHSAEELIINEKDLTVTVKKPICIDLGGLVKGYIIDKMSRVLQEWEIDSYLLHSGFSSIISCGLLQKKSGWPVVLVDPWDSKSTIKSVSLFNQSMSCSGTESNSPILDPDEKTNTNDKKAVWVIGSDCTTTDAMSTAFKLSSLDEVKSMLENYPELTLIYFVQGKDPLYFGF